MLLACGPLAGGSTHFTRVPRSPCSMRASRSNIQTTSCSSKLETFMKYLEKMLVCWDYASVQCFNDCIAFNAQRE